MKSTKCSNSDAATDFASGRDGEKLLLSYRADASLSEEDDRQLRHLLFACFPYERAFLRRRFLKEQPANRWIVCTEKGEFVAHAALHEKMIGTSAGELRIGGVAEICVSAEYRGRGLVKLLFHAMHDWMRERKIDFSMLFGQPKIYASSGYALIGNELRADNALARHWNPFCGKPMVCRLSNAPWPSGMIDLRGPTF